MSFDTINSRLIHLSASVVISFFFSTANILPGPRATFPVCSSVGAHMDWLHVLAPVNSTAMNTAVQVSLWCVDFQSAGYTTGSG